MKIIISPAKKIRSDVFFMEAQEGCFFPSMTDAIMKQLQTYSVSELQQLLSCNEKIARKAYQDTQQLDVKKRGACALFAFDGIQYSSMACDVFDEEQLEYVQDHLFILSALYGAVKPLTGIQPYRLELEDPFIIQQQNLYEYWHHKPAQWICEHDSLLIDLASVQYSKLITRHLPNSVRVIRCFFMEDEGHKRVEKGVYVKMARGKMVRWLAENKIENSEDLKQFHELGYVYSAALSNEQAFVFIRNAVHQSTNSL